MYASSIFGWLEFLRVRTGAVHEESPVSASELTERHTDACQLGLVELATQLEPLFDPGVVPGEQSDTEAESMATVLDRIDAGQAPRLEELDPAVGRVVDRSPRWEIASGYVFVIVDTAEYSVNVPPVLSSVADSLELLLKDVQRIVKFLGADDVDGAQWLIERWKHTGGLVLDLYRSCIQVLRRADSHHTVRDSVDEFFARNERTAATEVSYTHD